MGDAPRYVVELAELGRDDVARVGGKNASLGEMLRELTAAGIRVPPGFAVTAEAYRAYLAANDLEDELAARLDELRDGREELAEAGRSIRAALDALSDFGRPSAIRLAVLVDRGGRELPIQPDYVGLKLNDVPRDHHVQVRLRETDGVDEITVGPGE